MDIEEVKKALKAIEQNAGDGEAAHIIEDELFTELIREISTGRLSKKEMVKMCKLAIKSLDIEFSRYCA